MEYDEIKKTIEADYVNVNQVRILRGGRGGMKTFYLNFSKALEELHTAVGPFVTTKEQFIEQIRYLKEKVSPAVYEIILQYCRDKFKLEIGG